MHTYLLMVGDRDGLRDGDDFLAEKSDEIKDRVRNGLRGYSGPTGIKAEPDPDFVQEVIRRRSALRLPAIRLSKAAGYSGSYVAMIENGSRFASEEAKEQIRQTLNRLEQSSKHI